MPANPSFNRVTSLPPWGAEEEVFVDASERGPDEEMPSDETGKHPEPERRARDSKHRFSNSTRSAVAAVATIVDPGGNARRGCSDPPGVDSKALPKWPTQKPSIKNKKVLKLAEPSADDDNININGNGNIKGNDNDRGKRFSQIFRNGRGKGSDNGNSGTADPNYNGVLNNSSSSTAAEDSNTPRDVALRRNGNHSLFKKMFRKNNWNDNTEGTLKSNDAFTTAVVDPSNEKRDFLQEEFTAGEPMNARNNWHEDGDEIGRSCFTPDCYSLIAIHGPFEKKPFFWFGLMVFIFQMTFLILAVMSSLKKNKDVDNPAMEVEGSFWANFVPSNVEPLVRITQIVAILSFFIFADSSLRDCVVAVELFPRLDKANGEENYALVILSCALRFTQGFMATIVTFFLIVSSDGTIDIILNFAAINFISTLDECAFDLAKWGKYGPALESATKAVEERVMPPCMQRKYNHVRYLYTVLPCLLIVSITMLFLIFKQEFGSDWRTQTLRVQFQYESGLSLYSGCFRLDERNDAMHSNRKVYQSYDKNAMHGTMGYCQGDHRWVLYKGEGDLSINPCDVGRENELAHSSSTTDFDIGSSSDEIWYSASGTPLEMYFFDTEGNGDDLVDDCGSFLNNGVCDESLNTLGYHFDEGDCCAATCDQITCGHGGAEGIFGTTKIQGDTGIGFHNCHDPSMVPVTIVLNTITSSRGDDAVTTEPREPTFHVYCDSINVLSVNIDGTMEGASETLYLKDGAHCRVSVINATSVDDDLADPIWWVDYSIYHGANATNEILHEYSGNRDTIFFDLIQMCYFEKLKGYVDITTAYSILSLNWLVTDESGYSDCDESFLLERFALSEMNFAAPIGEYDANSTIDLATNSSTGMELIASAGTDGDQNDEGLWIRREQQCRWQGVSCDKGLVESIALQHYGVTGSIPTTIGLFPGLTRFNYDSNELTGTIPTEIGNLTNLKGFDLDHNMITGTIPTEIGRLTKMQELDLDTCNLEGTIPTELGNMIHALDFEFQHNKISGPIPSQLGNCGELLKLNFTDNHVYGTIPDSILTLGNLTHFQIGTNHMIGRIQSGIGKMSSLTALHFDHNNFSGMIPSELGLMTALTSIRLNGNSFTGTIPSEIGYLTNLRELHLDENKFDGPIPSQIISLLRDPQMNLTSDLPFEIPARIVVTDTGDAEVDPVSEYEDLEAWDEMSENTTTIKFDNF